MGRPVTARTVEGFSRDIEAINRLRISVLLDRTIEETVRFKVGGQCDELMKSLLNLAEKRNSKS